MGKIAEAVARAISQNFETFVVILSVTAITPIVVVNAVANEKNKDTTATRLLTIQSCIALFAVVIALLGIFVAPRVSFGDVEGRLGQGLADIRDNMRETWTGRAALRTFGMT